MAEPHRPQAPRETSRETHDRVMASGLISKRRKQAYRLLSLAGPCTANELSEHTYADGLWKRLSELRDQGAVVEQGTRPCTVTGRRAIVWAVAPEPSLRPLKRRTAQGRTQGERLEKIAAVASLWGSVHGPMPIGVVERIRRLATGEDEPPAGNARRRTASGDPRQYPYKT